MSWPDQDFFTKQEQINTKSLIKFVIDWTEAVADAFSPCLIFVCISPSSQVKRCWLGPLTMLNSYLGYKKLESMYKQVAFIKINKQRFCFCLIIKNHNLINHLKADKWVQTKLEMYGGYEKRA